MEKKQSNYYEPYRSKKHGVWYYVIWYGVSIVVLVILMLVRGQFTWERFAATVGFMSVMGVVWYFMDRFVRKQEDAAIRRLEEKFGQSEHQNDGQ